MSKRRSTRTAWRQGRELLARLRQHYPALFPQANKDLKPWAVGEALRMRQDLAEAEDGVTVSNQVWRIAVNAWFHGDLRRRVAYLKCLTAGAPRYDLHGRVSGEVSDEAAAQAAAQLPECQAQLARLRADIRARGRAAKAATEEPQPAA